MEYFKPLLSNRCKNEESGTQHFIEDGKKKGFMCFRCERGRKDCKGANNCTFEKKEDSTDTNSQEKIAVKFQEMKKEMCRRRSRAGVGRSSHMIRGEIVPA